MRRIPILGMMALIALIVFGYDNASAQQSQFFAAVNGVDTGSCPSTAPCKTIRYTATQALATCVGGQRVVLNLGPGSWTEGVDFIHALPTCADKFGTEIPFLIQGAGSGKTFWNGCSTCSGTLVATGAGTDVSIRAMYIYSTGAPGQNTLYAQQGALIRVLDDIVFGQSTNQQIHCENVGSAIQLWNNYTIASGTLSGNHMGASTQCGIYAGPLTVTMGPNLIFGGPFLFAQLDSVLNLSITWKGGPINGRAYESDSLSIITTNGAGCASIPGSSHGSTSAGGLCL